MNTSYLGNPNLKKKNVPISWSQEEIEEFVKCKESPPYFIRKYVQIVHVDRGLIPFDLYDFQKKALNDFTEHRFSVILKARQLGISTTVAAYVCWLMLFQREKNVLVVATKLSTATNLVKKIKSIHKHLPAWLKIADININNRLIRSINSYAISYLDLRTNLQEIDLLLYNIKSINCSHINLRLNMKKLDQFMVRHKPLHNENIQT